MVAVCEVVRALKDPWDAHHYEQLAVEDLGEGECREGKYISDSGEIVLEYSVIIIEKYFNDYR